MGLNPYGFWAFKILWGIMVTTTAVDFLQTPSRNRTSVNLAKHYSAAAEDDDDDDGDDGCAKNLKQSFYFSPLERLAPIFTPTWPPLWLLMLPGAANMLTRLLLMALLLQPMMLLSGKEQTLQIFKKNLRPASF